jgi:hypothetical protein
MLDRPLDEDRRRALTLLAENRGGCSRAVIVARGFPLAVLKRLVRAGLAVSHVKREQRGDRTIVVERVKITEAGRQALL